MKDTPKIKSVKRIGISLALVLVAYFVLFHTPWIISYTSTYKEWYRNFVWIEAGKAYNADSIISWQNNPAIIKDYVRLYQTELFDKLFWAGKIPPDRVKDFQSLVTSERRDLIIVNIGPLMELPDDYERQRWIRGMEVVRSGDRSTPPQERAVFEFAMLNFRRLVFRNPYNKSSSTADDVFEIKPWP
jgi:hypothetical protein